MASNGLIANPKKTAMLFLNLKKGNQMEEISVGKDKVTQVNVATLLGIKMSDDQRGMNSY